MTRTIDIEALCADKGLRITEQRKTIARVLGDSEDHPDVETLHGRADHPAAFLRGAAKQLGFLDDHAFLAAALCSLRAQNVPAAGAALGLFWLASWLRDRAEAVILQRGAEVDDDGRGFTPGQIESKTSDGHFGLRALAGLVAEAGGKLSVLSLFANLAP